MDEGGSVLITLATTGVAAGSDYTYTLSGVSASDIVGGSLTGTARISTDGKAVIQVNLVEDARTEGLESLTLNVAGQSTSVSVNDTSTAAAAPSSFTVSASDISINNNIAGNNAVSVSVGASGAKTVTIQSDGVTSDGGFIVSGAAADITVDAGLQGDSITVVSNGNNVVNAGTGSGNDTVTIIGSGTNQINVGAGTDTVTGGSGNDTVVFASGDFTAADTVDGGAGTDTVVISGNGNVADAGNLVSVERLVLNGTTLSISEADLEAYITAGLVRIEGEPGSSRITISSAGATTIDLTGLNLTGIQQLIIDAAGANTATLKLSADQIAAVGTIVESAGDTLTVETSVAGYQALGAKAPNVTVTLVDTAANLLAAGNSISGVTATIGNSSVAQAQQALASGLTINYTLIDTAANLALAPVAVFDAATTVTISDTATAAQASAIQASVAAAGGFAAQTLTLNITDSASNVSNYLVDTIDADTITTGTETLTVAQAVALAALNANATYKIVDTPANLVAAANAAATNRATEITSTAALTVAQVTAINAGTTDIKVGYALSDSLANVTAGGAAAVVAAAGNLTVTGGTVTVAEALAVEALTNTGTTSYAVSDTITNLLAASSIVVASASAVQDSVNANVTVSQINSLVSKFGTAKVADANLVVSDTIPNLLQLSAGSVGEATTLTISAGVGTAAQIISLRTLTGAKMPAVYTVTDSAANLTAAFATAANLTLLEGAAAINVTGTPTVAEIAALNTALNTAGAGLNAVSIGYALTDTAANLAANVAAAGIVDNAANGSVTITGAASVAQFTAINARATVASGFALTDTAANLVGGAAAVDAAGVVTVSNAATVGDIVLIAADFTTTGADAVYGTDLIYSVQDLPVLFDNPNDATLAILNGAGTATMVGTVAQIFAGTLTTAERNVADVIVASDSLANLGALTAGQMAEIDRLTITDTNLDMTGATAIAVNALSAQKPTSYAVVDAFADFTAATPTAAQVSYLANATTVNVDDNTANPALQALTVAQFNTLDALTNGTINSSITDSVANLSAANAATAISSAVAAGVNGGVVVNNTAANVTQADTLATRLGLGNAGVTALVVTDTAANIQAAAATLVDAVTSLAVSDNGLITGNVALTSKVYTNGSSYGNYAIVDTAANVVAANAGLVPFARSVTITGTATGAQAAQLAALEAMGPITFNISDAAAAVATSAGRNAAVNITVTGTADVAFADGINAATNSGTTSYAISDTAASLATVAASQIAGIEAATGTVTATTAATAAQANTIAAFNKAVVFNISDTSAAVAASTGLGEATNIVTTDAATTAQAATIMAAANGGTTTIFAVSGTSAQVSALTLGANDTITTVTVTGTTTVADAAAIAAKDTGTNIGALTFATVSGSYADLKANAATVNLATNVTVNGAVTVAQAVELDALLGGVLTYSLSDSLNNIMADTAPGGFVDNIANTVGRTVTATDGALTIAQATALRGISVAAGAVNYSIVDNDANLVAAINANSAVLSGATSVTSANGTTLALETIGGQLSIVGTRAALSGLSSVLQGAEKVYEVSVADLAAAPDTFVQLSATEAYRVTDTIANLVGSNALLPNAVSLVATDAATVAQATVLANVGAGTKVYSLTDTAAAIAEVTGGANTLVDRAVNVTVTTAMTFDQAATLEAETNTGTLSYNISDVAVAFPDSSPQSLNAAGNITVTAGALNSGNAALLFAATNSGTTTIANVLGTSANLAALTLTANDTITSLTPTTAATVAELSAMSARAGSITAYNLTDTGANLAAATSAQLNGATNLVAAGSVTVAQAAAIDAATNTGTTTFNVSDTAANVLAGSAAVLGADANGAIVVSDTTVSAAVATQLRALDAANNGANAGPNFTIEQGGAAGVFVISDTVANLTATANAAAVGASTDVRVTGDITVAQANSIIAAATGDAAPLYNVADTYSRLVAGLVATVGAENVRITNTVTVSQANAAAANFGATAAQLTMDIRDTASAVAAGIAGAGVGAAETVSVSSAATVAQAAILSESSKLVGGYTIADTSTAVVTALNTANGAGSDRETILGATSISLTTTATVGEALGVRGTEARGLYTVPGLSYTVTDSAVNILAGLAGSDVAGMENASSVRYNDATLTLAQAITLKAQANFGGSDGTGAYDLADAFATVQAADTALLVGAASVRANGDVAAETIDMSGLSRGVYANANGGADIVFGSEFADTLDGGTGADDLTGGNGRDAFAIEGGDSGTGAGLFDQITDYTVATAGWVGTAANDTVAEFQALTVGGAQADILDLVGIAGLAIAAGADVNANGVLQGVNALGTLADAVTLANGADAADVQGEAVVFEHGGNSYVFVENGADDILVELSAVTGVNGLALLGVGANVGGAGFVIIG